MIANIVILVAALWFFGAGIKNLMSVRAAKSSGLIKSARQESTHNVQGHLDAAWLNYALRGATESMNEAYSSYRFNLNAEDVARSLRLTTEELESAFGHFDEFEMHEHIGGSGVNVIAQDNIDLLIHCEPMTEVLSKQRGTLIGMMNHVRRDLDEVHNVEMSAVEYKNFRKEKATIRFEMPNMLVHQ